MTKQIVYAHYHFNFFSSTKYRIDDSIQFVVANDVKIQLKLSICLKVIN
jgi:hypothetical protein